jgi:exodeoxyribonuclease VII large subunit
MEKEYIDLFEFQSRLKQGIECLFPSRIWVKAEVSAVKARSGGHCYMELSQSDANGLVAKANAIIWASKYRFIAPYFESVTGSPLSEGMSVLVEVQVNYSQLYGFSLIINDIDPEYSLGVKELERQRTIERLAREGLMELQKGLSLPLLPYRLAVISAEDAAGYRDFMRHLHENPYGFQVDTELYPALMQGADCPESIITAMDAVLDSGKEYDAVLVLRGGGSKLDLACFDDYGLAAVIAQFPLPVLTAIGHDQDFHVCDMVAHEYVKTPTALADFILSMYEDEDARLSSFQTRMRLAFGSRITSMEAVLEVLGRRIKGGFAMKISAMEAAVALLQTRISASDPRKVIERGYALALDAGGRVMKGVSGSKAGDKVSMLFADGTLKCEIENVTLSS